MGAEGKGSYEGAEGTGDREISYEGAEGKDSRGTGSDEGAESIKTEIKEDPEAEINEGAEGITEIARRLAWAVHNRLS